MNENLFLETVFRNSLTTKFSGGETVYVIKFKQREFTITCSPNYPTEIPTISSHLTEDQLSNVYSLARTLVNTPMVYDLILACVKQDELDLNTSSSVVVDYDIGDAPRITPEQFFNWIEEHQRKQKKEERRTGKSFFESEKDVERTCDEE